MSRSGYIDDCSDTLQLGRWHAQVASAIRGRRGQAFLRELANAMDAMPEKSLISGQLVTSDGDCCTMGVICKARNIDVTEVDENDPEEVGKLVGIARQLAAEIAYENDEGWRGELPEHRWTRMREWVASKLLGEGEK